jgi:hypothetical protein
LTGSKGPKERKENKLWWGELGWPRSLNGISKFGFGYQSFTVGSKSKVDREMVGQVMEVAGRMLDPEVVFFPPQGGGVQSMRSSPDAIHHLLSSNSQTLQFSTCQLRREQFNTFARIVEGFRRMLRPSDR